MKFVKEYERIGKLDRDIKNIILMSKSPRRRDLLSFLNPQIKINPIDERKIENKFMEVYKTDDFLTRVSKTCCEIAKAKSNISLDEDSLYISADTIVLIDDKIYGKPKTLEEARLMFMSYFGRVHHVVTSVCLRSRTYLDVFYSLAAVKFVDYYKDLDPLVDSYIREENIMDKAGAYGIQDLDNRFIEYIMGDYNTIIGLPVSEISRRIFGVIN
ncbi:Maf family protein [Anaerococcus sp. AGMB09787]|uniref:Maf family protein n=1 Tax=Anaerococcus sp. AGMB09787 TaxID=2922869 RepID=UPI001FAF283A|nr:Maf family protein [Anaerococcus sp. AGMB09787]